MSTSAISLRMDGPRWNPRNEFLAFYGPEKGAQARVDEMYPSPSGDALLLVISQVYTGDPDDLWLLNLSSGTYQNITSTYPAPSEHIYRYDGLFWRADGNPRWECILHKKCELTENRRAWGKDISTDGNFVYEMDPSGVSPLQLFSAATDKKILTIGDEPTPGGSIGILKFSPRGRYHVIPQFMGHGKERCFLLDTKTRELELLSFNGSTVFYGYGYAVSVPIDSTDRFLAVRTDPDTEMTIIDLNSRTGRYVAHPDGLMIKDFAWSPDRTGEAFINVYDSKAEDFFITKTVERIE